MKKFFAAILNFFDVKATSALVSRIKPLDNFNTIAARLIDAIEKLNREKIDTKAAVAEVNRDIQNYDNEAYKAEERVKNLKAAGADKGAMVVSATLVLRHRQLATALLERVDAMEAANLARSEKIEQLGQRLEEVKGQIQLAKLDAKFAANGLNTPEAVGYDIDHLLNGINTLETQVDVFTNHKDPVSTADVDAYLNSL